MVKNKKITGVAKKELEKSIKEEIIEVQGEIEACMKKIKSLDKDVHMFPLYNCKMHHLETYKESLEEIKY